LPSNAVQILNIPRIFSAFGVAHRHRFANGRSQGNRLERGARWAGEDSKCIDGQFFSRTPANLTAGKKYKRSLLSRVASERSDRSQAVEFGPRSISNVQREDEQLRKYGD
jgi:hypothetical protein